MINYNFKKSEFQSYNFDINEIDLVKKEKVYILWTGGWDSSFRILQLTNKDVVIQPIYLSDKDRKSTDYELRAIDSIANKVIKLKANKCKILDLLILDRSVIKSDTEVSLAYKCLFSKKYIGSQYDWLARFAKSYKGIELCIHRDDKAYDIIKDFGNVTKVSNPQKGEYFILDKTCRNSELIKLFGDFHFPLLYYTKLDMKSEVEILGLTEIMGDTWFCYSPLNNQPCGLCNPCRYSIEEGMKYRFTSVALKRYRFKKIKRVPKEIIKFILQKIGLYSSVRKIIINCRIATK